MDLFNVYSLLPIEPVAAKGSRITDAQGQVWLDLYGGHAVISIGHQHPHYVQRLREQMRKISFYSNSVQIPIQKELAEKLGSISGYPEYQLFLCNSGAEANENALKLAGFVTGRKKTLAIRGSFHGRTSLAVAVTDDPSIRSSLNSDHAVDFLEMNDEAGLKKLDGDQYAAVIIEGIQGVGGIIEPTATFLQALRAWTQQYGSILILDEVQSGYGRTGRFFAHQHAHVRPDIISIAKGMGNGFPIGGILIHPNIPAKPGMLGTTFGGNHLACAAGLAVLEVIESESLIEQARMSGDIWKKKLLALDGIQEIRGKGLMLGLNFGPKAAEIKTRLQTDHRILLGTSSRKDTLRVLPALNVRQHDIAYFMDSLSECIEKEKAYA